MGSRRAAKADKNITRFSCLFPRLEGNSPRMEEPERRVTDGQACVGSQMSPIGIKEPVSGEENGHPSGVKNGRISQRRQEPICGWVQP